MNDHLLTSNEEHLKKTWSKVVKTTEQLNELEAVEGEIKKLQADKESMKSLLDDNSNNISDLQVSAKKLELENMELKKDLASLQKQLEEVKRIAADDKEEVRSLKAEYKALKKDVEELRCKKAYPAEEVKPEKNKGLDSISTLSYWPEKASAKKPGEEKQKESKNDVALRKKTESWRPR